MKVKQLGKRSDDHRLSEKRGALMVVSVLIATLTYQAALNPSGGFWQDAEPRPAGSSTAAAPSPYMAVLSSPEDQHEAGIAINKNIRGFQCFLIANTVALFASLVIILLLSSAITIRRRLMMWMLMIIMWISVFSVACSFLCGVRIILRDPSDQEANYLSYFSFGCMALFALLVLLHAFIGLKEIYRRLKPKLKSHRQNVDPVLPLALSNKQLNSDGGLVLICQGKLLKWTVEHYL